MTNAHRVTGETSSSRQGIETGRSVPAFARGQSSRSWEEAGAGISGAEPAKQEDTTMKTLALGLLTMAMAVGPSAAFAKTTEGDAAGVAPSAVHGERLLADSVVVTPQSTPTHAGGTCPALRLGDRGRAARRPRHRRGACTGRGRRHRPAQGRAHGGPAEPQLHEHHRHQRADGGRGRRPRGRRGLLPR